jgi:hypothetical protein
MALTGEALPTQDHERAAPAEADRMYERAATRARALVREDDAHRILGDANAEYGFRRNCLGIRREGILLSAGVTAASFLLYFAGAGDRSAGYLAPGIVGLVLLAFWLKIVKPDWARVASERYSDHFFETIQKGALQRHDPR